MRQSKENEEGGEEENVEAVVLLLALFPTNGKWGGWKGEEKWRQAGNAVFFFGRVDPASGSLSSPLQYRVSQSISY